MTDRNKGTFSNQLEMGGWGSTENYVRVLLEMITYKNLCLQHAPFVNL